MYTQLPISVQTDEEIDFVHKQVEIKIVVVKTWLHKSLSGQL